MLETVHSVVVLLTAEYSNRLLVVAFRGGASDPAVVERGGAIVVPPGAAVTGLHCVETGADLELDSDYAVFHTDKPEEFVDRFVPQLRLALERVGWGPVKRSLERFLAGRATEDPDAS